MTVLGRAAPLAALLALAAPSVASAGVVRHALIVGANYGGDTLEPLRYAESDAERMAKVLGDLGDFAPENVRLLRSPTVEEVRDALAGIPTSPEDEDLVLFYYSGHADARGLRVGSGIYPFEQLKQDFEDVDADVRLGILDACRSGTITRVKGATVVDPFLSEALDAEGEAWITASSENERAQESDALQSSFFTYFLVSGLRGAADGGDGVVSLNEAYTYAYDQTVARTGGTYAGAQHPEYQFKLQGKGDLELTVLERAEAWVTLSPDTKGRVMILEEPERKYVAEVVKDPGKPMMVALEPGLYRLRRRDEGQVYEVLVSLSEGANHDVYRWGNGATEVATSKGFDEEHHPDGTWAWPMPINGSDVFIVTQEVAKDAVSYGFRHNPYIAGGLSGVLPGSGQMYNGQWLRGGGMMLGSVAMLGTGFALFNTQESQAFTGSPIGPNALTAMGWMLYGWSVSDAVSYHYDPRQTRHPHQGATFSLEAAWWQEWETPHTAGIAADFQLTPWASVGLDRTGWTRDQLAESGGTFAVGGRAMVGPDWRRYRPSIFVASGARIGTTSSGDTAKDSTLRLAVGAGTMHRLYLNPRYFVQYELRFELDGGDPRWTNGAGLGLHFGDLARR
ncbi:MAG: caspase family protein [Alphaproteobacteria bacterium]|nr:caspase family protein [Alphaproteobacteria bacterium]